MFIIAKTKVESSWALLKQAIADGNIREVLHSGDTIPVTLRTGEETSVVATYDKKGKLFFVFDNCLRDPYRMNPRFTNGGAWTNSEMREHLKKLFALLPDELQAVIETTHITQTHNGNTYESDDKLFLLSEEQVFGKCRYSEPEENVTQLDIFTTERGRVKEREGVGTEWWWLRSPYSGSGNDFALVNTGGSVYNYSASNAYGVAPGFCI